MPNQNIELLNVKPAARSAADINYNGPSFAQSLGEIARSANIQVAQGATASELQFLRQKEGFDKPFDFEDAEEEMLDNYISRIKKMVEEMKK
ncbi:MAG: hypothetical protein JW782_06540 [Candidatus Saganbacteria bacterium]|nr:hypothetical protein [Candidatus Saganbacteria bacterium]